MGTYRSGKGDDSGKSDVESLYETARYLRDFFDAEQYVTTCLARYAYFQTRYSAEDFVTAVLSAWSPLQRSAYERMSVELAKEFEYVRSLELKMGEYQAEAFTGIANVVFGSDAWEQMPELSEIERASDAFTERIKAVEAFIRSVVAAQKQYEACVDLLKTRLEGMSRLDEGVRIWLAHKKKWWADRNTTPNIRFVEIDEMLRKTMIGDQLAKDLGKSISCAAAITASLLQYATMLMSPEFTGIDRMSDETLDKLLDAIRRIQVVGERVDTRKEPGSTELYMEVYSIQNSCVDALESFFGGE